MNKTSPVRVAELALVGFALAFFLSAIAPLNVLDHDLFHIVSTFRECVRQGRVILEDPFAYTPTVFPVIHHELGSGAVFSLVLDALGFAGLMLLRVALVAGVLACVILRARRAGAGWITISLLSVIPTSMGFIGFGTVRAQLFTILGVALLLWMVGPKPATTDEPPPPWLFLPVWLTWLNLHAGFVAGGGLLAVHAVETMVRHRRWLWSWFLIGLIMAVLVCVNPYGLHYPAYVLQAVTMPRPDIPEWRPIWNAEFLLQGAYLASLLVGFYALYQRGLRHAHGVAVLMACAIVSGMHLRHLPLYAVAWMGTVPAWLEGSLLTQVLGNLLQRSPRGVVVGAAAASLALLAPLLPYKPWRIAIPRSPEAVEAGLPMVYPVGAVDWLEERGFAGNLMTPFRVGAYVSWRLHPNARVSLDGRYEVAYQPGVFEAVEGFYRGDPGWMETLQRYPTHLVLARVTHAVVPLLEQQAGWRRVYDDGAYTILAPPA